MEKSKKWNINNVTVNIYLLPIYILAQIVYLKNLGISFSSFDLLSPLGSGTGIVFVSSSIYVYSSMFFQPDLDQHPEKPGMGTFPLGENMFNVTATAMAGVLKTKARAKKVLYGLVWPLNRFWFYFWAPYGILLTHRGISHMPIVGVLTRVYYIKGIIFLINTFSIQYIGIQLINADILDGFLFWELDPSEYHGFILFYLPVYLSDFCHTAIDFMESKIKGYDFCPPRIPRGVISKILPFNITI